MDCVVPDRISLLINLGSGVSEDRFDLCAHETYIAFRIGLPYEFWDAGDQQPILLLTCLQTLLCLPEFPKVDDDSKDAG